MRIAFASNLWVEHLGMMQVMGALRPQGHQLSLHISTRLNRLLKSLHAARPDVVAFSLTTNDAYWAFDLATQLKASLPSVRIVAGGPHPTLFPQSFARGPFDAICVGEGDQAFVEWLAAVEGNTRPVDIAGMWPCDADSHEPPRLRPLVDPLDSLPFAYREPFYRLRFLGRASSKTFLVSRGCWYSCRFCYNSSFRTLLGAQGQYRRIMSPERAVEEVAYVCKAYPTTLVLFNDDIFPAEIPWLSRFVPLYRERVGLPMLINARADQLNEDNVALYREARVRAVGLGVQTASQERRLALLGTGVHDGALLHAAELLHRHRISLMTYNMFGLPGETAGDVLRTIKLSRRLGARYSRNVMFQPYPGLPLTNDIGFNDNPHLDVKTIYYNSALKSVDERKVINLQNFSNWMVRHRFLDGIIRRLTALPPNPLFKVFFWITFLNGIRGRQLMRWGELLRLILRNAT